MEGKKCRNWWTMIWPNSEEEALAWKPAEKPKVKYCCWRVHRCPTTNRIHIHVLFQFKTVVRYETLISKGFNNIKWIVGNDNIEKKRNYCIEDTHRKDQSPKGVLCEFREIGTWSINSVSGDKKTPRDEYYKNAFSKEISFREGIQIIRESCPRDYALYGETIERNLKRTRIKKTEVKYKISDFNMAEIDFEEKSVLLWGPTGIGKTQFAKAHFENPLVVSQMDDLHNYNEEYDGIIFDDMSFINRPPNTIIHLLDWDEDRTIYCRYKNATIPARTRKIFTYNNENPFYDRFLITDDQFEAIERRLKRINVTDKLF